MKDTIKKTFVEENWIVCLGRIRAFIDTYNLELICIDLKKQESNYIATITYKLGLR